MNPSQITLRRPRSRFGKNLLLGCSARPKGVRALIEIEVQNETTQTEERLRFSAVPRIGEGIRLQGPDGFWASYDVVDLWYQKAEYGDVWVPYLHVRLTPAPQAAVQPLNASAPMPGPGNARPAPANANGFGVQEVYPFTA
jgi:hypothetical protein